MLTLTIPGTELYDDVKEEFVTEKSQTIVLEHSLISISKWESKWQKAFLKKEPKTKAESLDYVRCMTISQNIDESVYERLTPNLLRTIAEYIDDPMTATVIKKENNPSRDVITSELIYYMMIQANIPVEFQKWHLNRLLTLINVCNIKSSPPKKMSKRDVAIRNHKLNQERREKLNTKG